MKYAAEANDKSKAGRRASPVYSLADPFSMYAIHTRFDAVEWFVVNEAARDRADYDGLADVVRQGADPVAVALSIEGPAPTVAGYPYCTTCGGTKRVSDGGHGPDEGSLCAHCGGAATCATYSAGTTWNTRAPNRNGARYRFTILKVKAPGPHGRQFYTVRREYVNPAMGVPLTVDEMTMIHRQITTALEG